MEKFWLNTKTRRKLVMKDTFSHLYFLIGCIDRQLKIHVKMYELLNWMFNVSQFEFYGLGVKIIRQKGSCSVFGVTFNCIWAGFNKQK